MSHAIYAEAIHKTYASGWRKSPKEALKGVSLAVEAGETFGFIGPNGAGKSTLIKILIGALRPSTGSASVFGYDVCEPEARRRLGFVPESPSLPDFLSPCEILTMGIRLHALKLADERRHCMYWLERFGLAAVADNRLRGFSKGMRQRTALAHAMAVQPRLLILDEPLSGLDPVGRKDVVDILDEYRGQGGTLFFSSHVLHDVERIADRFGLIHGGQLLTVRSPQQLVAEQADSYVLRYRGDRSVAGCVELRPGLYGRDASAVELPALLAEIHASGGVLQEVEASVSLESVFFATISPPASTPG